MTAIVGLPAERATMSTLGGTMRTVGGRGGGTMISIVGTRGVAVLLPLFAVAAGCIHRPAAPAPPHGVHVVTVLPAANRTGDPLLITGTSLLERYAFRTERVTVADALAQEAAAFLRARGYRVNEPSTVEGTLPGHAPDSAEDAARVASHAGLEGFVLYLEIRRWEPDAGMLDFAATARRCRRQSPGCYAVPLPSS